jgi:NhaA family Na+:H+ antiporter
MTTDAPQQGNRPAIARVLGPFERFAARESAGGILLLVCAVVALAWANSPWAASYEELQHTPFVLEAGPWRFEMSALHFINDGLMAVFFFVVGLEIKREMLVGELASLRQAALPLAGALGGMLTPALLYVALNAGGPGEPGWGIPMATDIAFALGILALLGSRVPISLKIFLTALAIVDDIGAILVIALFYSHGLSWEALGAAAGLLMLSVGANRVGVQAVLVYALIGVALWAAVLQSGVHATVAGVLLAFTIPARTFVDERQFLGQARRAVDDFGRALPDVPVGLAQEVLTNEASREALHRLERLVEVAQPPLHRLEHGLHGVVALGIMPLFALANAGVPFGGGVADVLASPVALGVILGLVVGKPVGITVFAWLAVRLGVASPPAAGSWAALHAVSWLGGIGFTMSLFIAALAFSTPETAPLLTAAKIGILLASALAGVIGYTICRRVASPPRPRTPDPESKGM